MADHLLHIPSDRRAPTDPTDTRARDSTGWTRAWRRVGRRPRTRQAPGARRQYARFFARDLMRVLMSAVAVGPSTSWPACACNQPRSICSRRRRRTSSWSLRSLRLSRMISLALLYRPLSTLPWTNCSTGLASRCRQRCLKSRRIREWRARAAQQLPLGGWTPLKKTGQQLFA